MQQATEMNGVTLDQSPDQSAEYIQCLQSMVHSHATLKQKGFIIEQLPTSDLERKKRCQRCCRALNTAKPKKTPEQRRSSSSPTRDGPTTASTYRDRTPPAKPSSGSSTQTRNLCEDDAWVPAPAASENKKNANNAKNQCKYHDGEVDRKTRQWTCCNKPAFTKPCKTMDIHDPRQYKPGELEKNWLYHHTPLAIRQSRARIAVVFDCEMGVTEAGESELIRVSVVDYFTSDILLDSLVWPDAKMSSLNTPFSGVSWKALNDARRNRTCIFGREKARKAVWSLISPETIVIGHGANNDLNILRWIHPSIVDTLLVEQEFKEMERLSAAMAEEAANVLAQQNGKEVVDLQEVEVEDKPKEGGLSLKKLAKERLDRAIQLKGKGHDSIEDAVATRDILHWHVARKLQTRP
ncbi:hypothetical protein PG987_008186 [Apiospora arundinis]